MTSNIASDEIAGHAMQLREEAKRMLTQRLDKNADEDEKPENIVISRHFKDHVVCF